MPRINPSFDDLSQQNDTPSFPAPAEYAMYELETRRLSLIMQVIFADLALGRTPTLPPEKWGGMIAESVSGLRHMSSGFLEQKRRVVIMELGFLESQMGLQRTIPPKNQR